MSLSAESDAHPDPTPTSQMSTRAGASSLQLVAFLIDGTRYAVPLTAAERVFGMVAVYPLPGAPEALLGVINVHGRPIAVVDVRRRVGLAAREYDLAAHLLIVSTPRRRLAIATDEVLGPVEIEARVVAPPQAISPGRGSLSGVAALAQGLLFIYDLEAFLTPDEERLVDHALEARR